MIPLLIRLDQEFAQCTEPLRRGELLAERACYLARVGQVDVARNIAADLRSSGGGSVSAQLTIWAMLVEGLVLYFDRLAPDARDRLRRAWTLSQGLALRRLSTLSAAWLAHMEFDRSEYASMAQLVGFALANATPEDADVHLRIGLVLGDAYLHAGDRNAAQAWYESARGHAVALGDEAALGALMYNRSSFGLSLIRVREALEDPILDPSFQQLVTMEIESALSFETGTHVRALAHLTRLYQARVLLLGGEYERALDLLTPILDNVEMLDDRIGRAQLVADVMLCCAEVGRSEEAVRLHGAFLDDLDDGLDVDDRLVALAAATRALRRVGRPDLADSLLPSLDVGRRAYEDAMVALRGELAKIQ